ncbi:MAG: glycosyltransferase [Anaerolineae bacterium]|nr:glycosyltransferase [Anaerolineae bacterium]
MRVLMITTEWPTAAMPHRAPFIVREVEFLRKLNVDVDVFPLNGSQNPLNYAAAWRQVRQKLHTNAYDLIHAQFGQSAIPTLGARVPLVVTFRGSDVIGFLDQQGRYTFKGRLLSQFSRYAARIAAEVIVVSKGLISRLPPREYHVIPSGIDLDHFCPMPREQARARLGLARDRQYVLFVGSKHNPIKRYELAQEAVNVLQQTHNAELLLAMGVSHEDIPLYMNACDALVLTSTHGW